MQRAAASAPTGSVHVWTCLRPRQPTAAFMSMSTP